MSTPTVQVGPGTRAEESATTAGPDSETLQPAAEAGRAARDVRHPAPSPAIVWLLRALCLVALGVSGYLAWVAFNSSKVAGCGSGVFDCSHVLTSRWSQWLGVPVSAAAFGMYATVLAALCFCRADASPRQQRTGWGVVTACGLAAGLAAVWFISLQLFVIQHVCMYCMTAHLCGLAVAAIVLWKSPLDARTVGWLSAASVAGVALLASGQMLAPPPPTFQIEHHPESEAAPGLISPPGEEGEIFEAPGGEIFEPPVGAIFEPPGADLTVTPPAAPQPPSDRPQEDPRRSAGGVPLWLAALLICALLGATPASADPGTTKDATSETGSAGAEATATTPAPPARRVIRISGATQLDVRQWPLLGKPEAKYVFAEMFDYTCSHCQKTHHAIHGAMERYGDDLAVIALPVPLNAACNNTVTATHAKHIEACELARLAMAVWRLNSPQFPIFHDWLFEPSGGRRAAEARVFAAQLVGEEALRNELASGIPDKFLATHVTLFTRAGKGQIPKLLFPRTTLVGEVGSTDTVCNTIERELGGR